MVWDGLTQLLIGLGVYSEFLELKQKIFYEDLFVIKGHRPLTHHISSILSLYPTVVTLK